MADYFASLPTNVAIGLATLIIGGLSVLLSLVAVLVATTIRKRRAKWNPDHQPNPADLPPSHFNCRCHVEPMVKWQHIQDSRTRKQQQAEDQKNGH